MKHTEQTLEDECCKFARSKGIAAVKLERVKGLPDRLFVKSGGQCLFVEFKRPDGKGVVSVEQAFWAKYLSDSHVFIDSFDDFKNVLQNYFNLKL